MPRGTSRRLRNAEKPPNSHSSNKSHVLPASYIPPMASTQCSRQNRSALSYRRTKKVTCTKNRRFRFVDSTTFGARLSPRREPKRAPLFRTQAAPPSAWVLKNTSPLPEIPLTNSPMYWSVSQILLSFAQWRNPRGGSSGESRKDVVNVRSSFVPYSLSRNSRWRRHGRHRRGRHAVERCGGGSRGQQGQAEDGRRPHGRHPL